MTARITDHAAKLPPMPAGGLGRLALLLPYVAAAGPIIWGSTYLVTTELLPPGRPLLAAAARALPSGLVLSLLGRRLPDRRWLGRVLTLGMLNIGAFFPFLFMAAYRLPGGIAAVIGALQPLLVVGLSAFWLRTQVSTAQVSAALLGAGGVALLVLRASARLDALGLAASALSTLSMATGTVLVKHWGRPHGISLITFTGWQLLVGGMFLTPLALSVEGLPASLTAANLSGFAYLAGAGALLAYPLWFFGLDRLPVASAALLGLLSPVTATLLGFLVLDQRLSLTQLVGAVHVLLSVVIGQRSGVFGTRSSTHE